MKSTNTIWIAAIAITLFAETGFAQIRKPSPTGQIPKSYSGQSSSTYSDFKPKPTGQIAPAAEAAPATQVNGQTPARATTTVEGQVPKVNSNQDPRTFPERYNPAPVTPSEEVLSIQQTSILPAQGSQQQGTQQIETTTTTQQLNTPDQKQQPVNQSQNTNAQPAARQQQTTQQTTSQQRTVTQPKSAGQPSNVPAASQKLQPNY